ncbi:hypothetical protein DFH09DRAFT_1209875 [Mycena vulgaris]|nr:hypothetical protein DFH09DRAFT_1209875 [Mycena vulgaris]
MPYSAPMASSFSPKLGTNYCPNDDEVVEIRALLVEPTLRLERLDNEIAALISPVRRLPIDIIQEIFAACMPTHRNCVMSAREAPVLLGRICGSWRTLSLATPRLWASLHVVEPTRPFANSNISDALFEAKVTQRQETAKTWLGRSGQLGTPSDPPSLHTGRFLQALIQFAPRWQHVSFSVPSSALDALRPLTESDVPVLESIRLSPRQLPGLLQFDWGRSGMFAGARISSFSIWGSNFRMAELPLRWHLLTSLSILGPLHFNHLVDAIISRCLALRSCALRLVDEPSVELRTPHPIVEHRFMETLQLVCMGTDVGSTLERLLAPLSLPRLRNLTLNIHWLGLLGQPQGSDTLTPLLRFLASSTYLETVDIDTATFSKSFLLEILDSLPPTVLYLRLDDNQHSDGGWGWDQPTHYSGLDDHRWMAVFPLQRVQVEFSRPLQRDIMPDLQPTIDGGLEVQITYPPAITMLFSPWQGLPDAFGNI